MNDVELKPCPFCGSKEAPEYYCGYEINECPYHDDIEMFEIGYRDECKFFDCDKYNTYVVCNVNKGGCGASTGYSNDSASLWNKRVNV